MADLKGHANSMLSAFNSGDLDTFMSLAGDSVYEELGTQRSLSGDDYREALVGWRTAFPDVSGTVTNTIEAGNTLVQELTWTGTNTGPMATPGGEIPPTGKSQTTKAAWVLEFEGDQLKTTRHYFDMLGLLQQLGIA